MTITELSSPPAYLEFLHDVSWRSMPDAVQAMAKTCLADTLAVAASGTQTELSDIIRNHTRDQFAAPDDTSGARLLFDGRYCSAAGAALANGMSIDSVDAHDGYKPAKGHAGCGVVAAALALHDSHPDDESSQQFLSDVIMGYEIACRAAVSLHSSVPDYHTSGAWVALAASAIGARIMGLNTEQSRHALGIAEYHGPRSQMMRCIDHPTMLKDGSGWGAMAGVSAAYLARSGFTGAPAITLEAREHEHTFGDLGSRWLILEQYFKPYPVCRWSQPAVVAAQRLRQQHQFSYADIDSVTVGTFRESARLACREPQSTEAAQYSLPFPLASMLVHGELTVNQIDGAGLLNPNVLALSNKIEIEEVAAYDAVFPAQRISHLTIILCDGRQLNSGPTEAEGDPEAPLSEAALQEKFSQFSEPVLGSESTESLHACISSLEDAELASLYELIYAPIGGSY